jgi:NADPH:quinone reductase-like Zn-dependent oxidoreductase
MDFEVKRAAIQECRVVDVEPPPLESGQALMRVDAFALTTNNITYAVLGDALRYWDFFSAQDDATWGRVPVWGFADVIATTHDDVAEGDRVYGYLPMSTHLVVTPGRADPRTFVDVAAHRAGLPGAYNQYQRVDADPLHDPAFEDHRMLLFPLFFTSFLIDDFLEDNSFFDAESVVVSSASSKTAIGTAFQLGERQNLEVVGLTSSRNADFVDGLDVYDRVVLYDEVDTLGGTRSAFVDIAGDAGVRAAVHRAFGDQLAHSMMVGATHWDERSAAPGDLPGPPPSLFFAPDQITKRTKEWGRTGLGDRVAEAWRHYVEFCDGWIDIRHGHGPTAVEEAYLELVEGRSDPTTGHILSMWPQREG